MKLTSDSEDIYNVTKDFLFQINAVLLHIYQRILKSFHKNVKQQQLFSTLIIRTLINNWAPIIDNSSAVNHHIIMISEDHVTLKTLE